MKINELAGKAEEVSRRVAELVRLESELQRLHALGLTYPIEDGDGKTCVCHLVSRSAS